MLGGGGGGDFDGVSACVEEVVVRTRNAKGERYERTWVGHAIKLRAHR